MDQENSIHLCIDSSLWKEAQEPPDNYNEWNDQ